MCGSAARKTSAIPTPRRLPAVRTNTLALLARSAANKLDLGIIAGGSSPAFWRPSLEARPARAASRVAFQECAPRCSSSTRPRPPLPIDNP